MKPSTKKYLDLISENKGVNDITIVLNTDEMMDLVAFVNEEDYEDFYITSEGMYNFVSSLKYGFYIESVYSLNEEVKLNNTDILYLPSYLPSELFNDLMKSEYNKVALIM